MGIRTAALLVAAVALAAMPARADKTKKAKAKNKTKDAKYTVDIAPAKDKLHVLRSDGDHYIVIDPKDDKQFYFGDSKRLYRQWNQGSGGDMKKGYAYFWSPRIGQGFFASGNRWRNRSGELTIVDNVGTIECGERQTPFQLVEDDAAAKLLDSATFYEPLWKRDSYWLARDDMGVYYYVDHFAKEYGGKGYRVFVGPKGKMKETRLINVAVDSGGAVFATKKGSLGLVTATGEEPKTRWIKKKQRTELTTLPVGRNAFLIYEELGVYEGELMGTPCDYY
jgi:hypothetical protein